MPLTKPEVQKDIINTLTTMTSGVANENAVGFFDSNRAAQDFFVGLFDLMFGYKNLDDLDIAHDTTSFPAVDIGDSTEGIAIQITSRTDREKITHTLETFIKNGLQETYPRLIICMLGTKENYRDGYELGEVLDFDLDRDVWDIPYLCSEIMKIDLEILKRIQAYFTKYLKSISVNRLFDQDIAESIELLERDVYKIIDKLTLQYSQLKIANRAMDFIEKKNNLNGMTWDMFKVIQGHLTHNQKITAFLSNPNNEELSARYLTLTNTLQSYYTVRRDVYIDIEMFMKYIFGVVDTYETDIDSNKIKIILHNMYFNCDLGDNPSEN